MTQASVSIELLATTTLLARIKCFKRNSQWETKDDVGCNDLSDRLFGSWRSGRVPHPSSKAMTAVSLHWQRGQGTVLEWQGVFTKTELKEVGAVMLKERWK